MGEDELLVISRFSYSHNVFCFILSICLYVLSLTMIYDIFLLNRQRKISELVHSLYREIFLLLLPNTKPCGEVNCQLFLTVEDNIQTEIFTLLP